MLPSLLTFGGFTLRTYKQPKLTLERFHQVMTYDPETGIFYWVVSGRGRYPGKRAGTVHTKLGYRTISIDKERLLAHRLAWFVMHGVWPPNEVDHKFGVVGDDRISQLRCATHAQNRKNSCRPRTNRSGYTGVTWNKNRRCWQAQIVSDNRYYYLGKYDSPEEAAEARSTAAKEMFGEFARTNEGAAL